MSSRPPTAGKSSNGRPTSSRPSTSGRSRSSMSRAASSYARPGTASSRSGSAVTVGIPPATAVGISTQINIAERPMSQQGLGGFRTGIRPTSKRLVQDKSYFQGVIRTKISELNTEVSKLGKEVGKLTQEQSTYAAFDKHAQTLAKEIKEVQGELGDYNMLVDKLNTDMEIDEVTNEYEELKLRNEKENQNLESILRERHQKEQSIKDLEREIVKEQGRTVGLVSTLSLDKREKYEELHKLNQVLLVDIEKLQQEISSLNSKKTILEDEIAVSKTKQECASLHHKIRELEDKKKAFLLEESRQETPEQETERLLNQVKEDNHELATMERQIAEVQQKTSKLQEDIQQLDQDMEDGQSEHSQKYRELKKREEMMDEFQESFDVTIESELTKKRNLESSIVALLEKNSNIAAHFQNLPSVYDFAMLREDLRFKEGELEKSKTTSVTLMQEQKQLVMDLKRVEQLEDKIKTEMKSLQEKMKEMEDEIIVFEDLDGLRTRAEDKRLRLLAKLKELTQRKQTLQYGVKELQEMYDNSQRSLDDNETNTQLSNLEKKWQYLEQTNFAMREFIASKTAEADYRPTSKAAFSCVQQQNKALQDLMSRR